MVKSEVKGRKTGVKKQLFKPWKSSPPIGLLRGGRSCESVYTGGRFEENSFSGNPSISCFSFSTFTILPFHTFDLFHWWPTFRVSWIMRYVAAYLLATLGGKASPTAADLKKILDSVGIEAENDRLDKVVKELTGKNVTEVIAEGSKKLASVPSGGAPAPTAGGAAPTVAATGGDGSPAKEDRKAKKEESEEEDDDMGFGLFD